MQKQHSDASFTHVESGSPEALLLSTAAVKTALATLDEQVKQVEAYVEEYARREYARGHNDGHNAALVANALMMTVLPPDSLYAWARSVVEKMPNARDEYVVTGFGEAGTDVRLGHLRAWVAKVGR